MNTDKILFTMTVLLILFLIPINLCAQTGDLFIIGGGNRPASMINHLVELAGGEQSHVIVIPNASGDPIDVAEYQTNQFLEHGAGCAEYIFAKNNAVNADSSLAKIDKATCIFFSGGDQRRLTADLLDSKLLAKIKEKWRQGCVISGTSAGAAVMSELMITGDEKLNKSKYSFITIEPGNVIMTPGFGFVKKAIIDQHFIKRNRQNRLISVVLENPGLLGIGIDESTAIQVHEDGTFEVVGENSVMIFDAKEAQNIQTDDRNNYSASNIKMHLLINGQKFDMSKGKVK
ncbi:MAG: cyanophycinase [Fidelibacterota bacterium]